MESFWKDGRDRQFNFDSFRGTHPPHIHIIAGWNDMFLQQGLDDFVSDSWQDIQTMIFLRFCLCCLDLDRFGSWVNERIKTYQDECWIGKLYGCMHSFPSNNKTNTSMRETRKCVNMSHMVLSRFKHADVLNLPSTATRSNLIG